MKRLLGLPLRAGDATVTEISGVPAYNPYWTNSAGLGLEPHEEIREEGVGGVLDGDHDANGAVVLCYDHGLAAGRIEKFAKVVLSVACGHDFHRHILWGWIEYVHCSHYGHIGKPCYSYEVLIMLEDCAAEASVQ